MLIIQKTMYNGSIARYHKAVKMEIHPEATHVVVNSYHAPEMQVISWQDTYKIDHIPGFPITTLEDAEAVLALTNDAPFLGATLIGKEFTDLEEAKARKWAEVKIARQFKYTSGYEVEDLGKFDINEASVARLKGYATDALLANHNGTDFEPVNYTLADNTNVVLEPEDIFTACAAISEYIRSIHEYSVTLRKKIDDAETLEDVSKIDSLMGWP